MCQPLALSTCDPSCDSVGSWLLAKGLVELPDQPPSSSSQVPGQRGLGPSLVPEEEQWGTLTPEAGPRFICARGRPRPGWRFPAAKLGGQGEGATQQPEGQPVRGPTTT